MASSVNRPSANNADDAGNSAWRRAITTNARARRVDTPHCHATQCSGDRIPDTAHNSRSSTSAITETRSAVAELMIPINSATRPSTSSCSTSLTATPPFSPGGVTVTDQPEQRGSGEQTVGDSFGDRFGVEAGEFLVDLEVVLTHVGGRGNVGREVHVAEQGRESVERSLAEHGVIA